MAIRGKRLLHDKIAHVVCIDEADAENQVKEVFRECPNLIRVALSLRPEGFVFMWYKRPGKIEVNEYAE